MNMPTYDDQQAPNLRAANDHLRARNERLADQVASIPGLLQRIGVLEAQLRRAKEEIDDLTRERNQIKQERDEWRAAYPDLPVKTTGATT